MKITTKVKETFINNFLPKSQLSFLKIQMAQKREIYSPFFLKLYHLNVISKAGWNGITREEVIHLLGKHNKSINSISDMFSYD